MMRLLPALALCSLLVTQDQGDPQAARAEVTDRALHRGWLMEVLDGDHAGAAELYEQAVDDEQLPTHVRAFAAARAFELQRLGESPDPEALQESLRRLGRLMRDSGYDMQRARGFRTAGDPVSVEGLAAAARDGLEGLDAWLTARRRARTAPVTPRLFTPDLYQYLIEELERSRLSGTDSATRYLWQQITQGSSRPGQSFRRPRATEILKLFLEGNVRRANFLRRQLNRRQQRQVPMPEDPATALATAQRRLDRELARVDLNPADREALRGLAVHLEQLRPDRGEEAINFLRRLPVYGELLLGER